MVAWPSGLRRWFKAPVISMAWVRIPPLPILFFFPLPLFNMHLTTSVDVRITVYHGIIIIGVEMSGAYTLHIRTSYNRIITYTQCHVQCHVLLMVARHIGSVASFPCYLTVTIEQHRGSLPHAATVTVCKLENNGMLSLHLVVPLMP